MHIIMCFFRYRRYVEAFNIFFSLSTCLDYFAARLVQENILFLNSFSRTRLFKRDHYSGWTRSLNVLYTLEFDNRKWMIAQEQFESECVPLKLTSTAALTQKASVLLELYISYYSVYTYKKWITRRKYISAA